MLLLGEGGEKDVAKGLWWLEQAVANGWEYAATLLSDVYREGLFGVSPNAETAAFWNERAGEFKDRM
jgi:TPR repeat protein